MVDIELNLNLYLRLRNKETHPVVQITTVYGFTKVDRETDTCRIAVGRGSRFLNKQEPRPEYCFNGCGHEI